MLEPMYRCMACHELHDDEDDAFDCCQPGIAEVWLCPRCAREYDDECEAEDCCDVVDTDEPVRPTARELEAAGQLRLIK